MLPQKLLVTLGVLALFGIGFAAAAVADPLPIPTEPTTTSTTTTETTTSTTPPPETTSTSTTTTPPEGTTMTAPTTTSTAEPQPRAHPTPRHAFPNGMTVRDRPSATPQASHPKRKKHRRRVSKPLRVTPPLGAGSYVFPVAGPAGYGDSYGSFRGDVRGKWHHGADIFASLGTPVVAVADGTVNRVGWRRLGGWRLWVRNAAADQFYYAHLSGYAPEIFHSRHVRAGQVIGFVGNTGDAFGGAPHLHFEVHPHQLLRLQYDGAVNPTTYLDGWPRVQAVETPAPVHPRLPRLPRFRSEARLVFRQLLAARHLLAQPAPAADLQIDRPEAPSAAPPARVLAVREAPAPPRESSTPSVPLLVALLLVGAVVTTPVVATLALRRRWG